MDYRNDCRTPRDRIDSDMRRRVTCGCTAGGRSDVMSGNTVRRTQNARDNGGCNMPSLAMVYSPYQKFTDLYEVSEALDAGTIFRQLDLRFYGEKCCRGGGNR